MRAAGGRALRRVLADEPPAPEARGGPGGPGAFEIQRSLPHGHVAAVLGTLRRLAFEPILASKRSAAREARRAAVVAPAQRSARAARKAATQVTADEQPVHSFQTLLADLATLAKNRVRFGGSDAATLTIYTQPTPLQQHALALLQVNGQGQPVGSATPATPAQPQLPSRVTTF